jgi:ABC-type nitrate/sulfonate/bicarbonate transport system substrate-binding protein
MNVIFADPPRGSFSLRGIAGLGAVAILCPLMRLRLYCNIENIVSVELSVISTIGRNLRSLTFVRDDNPDSTLCEIVCSPGRVREGVKRCWRKPCALPLTILLFFAFCPSVRSQSPRLNVSYSSESPGSLSVWVAKDAGLYAKNGLDVQLLRVTGNVAVMAVVSGEVNIGLMGGSAVITSNLAGSDAVMVAAGQVSTDYSLVTHPKIKTAQQLKGGIIGVASVVGSAMTATQYALQKLGVSQKEVTLLVVGGTPERLAALRTGRIQATLLSPPTSFAAENEGYHILTDVVGMPLPYNSIASTRKFVRENPDLARKFIRAHLEAVALLKTNREVGLKTLAKYLRRTQDRNLLEKSYEISVSDSILPRKQYPTLPGIKTVLDSLVKTYPKAASAKPEEFVELAFIKELDESGFINGLYKN